MTTSTPNRIGGLDIGRFTAAIAVIWIHAPNEPWHSTVVARWAVSYFTALAVYLTVVTDTSSPWWEWSKRRAVRIYVPFLVWNLLYVLVQAAASIALHKPFPRVAVSDLLLDGVVHHLWFLPFILVLTVTLRLLVDRAKQASKLGAVAFALAGVAVAAVPRTQVPGLESHYAAALAWDNLPAGLGAASLALSIGGVSRLAALATRLRIWGWLSFVVTIVFLLVFGRSRLLENIAGVLGLVAFASLVVGSGSSKRLGSLAFGMYITHVLFLEGLQDLAPSFGLDPNAVPVVLGVFVGALTLSALTTTWILSVPALRRLLPE